MNASVNAIIWLPAHLQYSKRAGARDSVLACAAAVRKSLEKLKDPEFIKDMAAGVSKVLSSVAWDKMGQDLPSTMEGCMMSNNHWK
jgi:hypothetical protein